MESEQNRNSTGSINPQEKGILQSELFTMLREYFVMVVLNPVVRSTFRYVLIVVSVIASVIFTVSLFLYIIPALQDIPSGRETVLKPVSELADDSGYRKTISSLKKDLQRLSWKYSSLTPGQSYLVINTTDNRFHLYRNKKLIREGFCSSGSYTRLTTADGDRQWIFKTPKGMFWIQQKIVKPLWIRPDWSFVEEGLPIPPAEHESRYEYGVLGDYAMSLGDGYLIHGTIYKRFLGMPVTHGCVRLNDEDLETIFNTLNIGSKVYIF